MTGPRNGFAAPAAVAVAAATVFFDGGYSAEARVVFGALAVAAAVAFGREATRSWVLWVLLALAALGALSALWTLGPVDRTLRWSLVTLGYAALFLVAAAAGRRRGGVEALAFGLALLAVAAGLAGLAGVVTSSSPWAERIAGVWRPGGPFEYPPALALLQVSALPALLSAVASRSRRLRAGGAAGLAVAGGVLALSASRVGLAMAVAVIGLAWLRRLLSRSATAGHAPVLPKSAAIAAIAIGALLAGSLAFGSQAGRGAGAESGFLHGRTDTWEAAIETFADRPLLGAGADAFLAGSARHQDGQTILFAHSLPLELAAELGIAGLLLALALYASAARLLWSARGTSAIWLLGPSVAAFLIAGLVDWPWHLAGAGAAWAIAAGGLAGAAARTEKQLPPYT
jgi:O-antigen ligase